MKTTLLLLIFPFALSSAGIKASPSFDSPRFSSQKETPQSSLIDHGNLRISVPNYRNPYRGGQLVGVYCTLSDNSMSWSPSFNNDDTMYVCHTAIHYNGSVSAAYIFKTAPGLYFLQYNHSGFTGGSFTVGGQFTNASKTDTFYLETSKLIFDTETNRWSQDDPAITYRFGEETSIDDEIRVSPTDEVNQLTFLTTKGTISGVEYGSGAIINGHFAIKDGENESVYAVNVNVSYDGATFTKRYRLRVGYRDFVMKAGAAPLLNGINQGLLRFSASIPSSLANDPGARFGMIVADASSLGNLELSVDSLFYHNEAFSFEKGTPNRIYVKNNFNLRPTYSNGSYLIEGCSEAIGEDRYATPYLAVAYMVLNNNYYLANHHEGKASNSQRSLYQIAQLAEDRNSSEASRLAGLYIDNYRGSTEVTYVVREHLSGNIKETIHSGTLNEVITVTAPSESGYRVTGANSRTSKLYAGENVFEFHYDYHSALDVYCWGFPELDPDNGYINAANEAICQNIRDCGITAVIPMGDISFPILGQYSADTYKHLIRMFDYYGLKTVVNGNYFSTSIEDQYIPVIDEFPDFSDTPGFAGFLLWDEPNITQITGKVIPYMDLFEERYGNDTDAMFMCNLLPSYAYPGQLGVEDYSEYINTYVNALNNHISSRKFISLDSYPIYPDFVIDAFPRDIAYLVGAARSMSNGFGQISIQSSQISGQTPDFTEADYGVQAYTAIAMGIDSINWFTYAQMEHISQDQVNVIAPVGKDGSLTDYYAHLKNATNKAKQFKELLDGYGHVGFYTSYSKFDEAKNVSSFNNNVSVGSSYNVSGDFRVSSFGNSIMGVFEKDGTHAYLVSHYAKSGGSNSTFRFYPYRQYTLYRFNGTNLTTTSYSSSYSSTSISLAPGEAVLFIPK